MKKLLLSVAVISAMGLSATSNAATTPTVGASGTITFTGVINTDSCVVHSDGPGSTGSNLTYNLGTVSSNTLGSEDQPATSGTSMTALPTNLNLVVECSTATTSVDLKLTPTLVSGKGIAVTGGAQNVQIMLTKADNSIIDFSSGSSTINGVISGGNSSMNLKAYYTRKAGKTVADVTAGQANATLAYTLSYN